MMNKIKILLSFSIYPLQKVLFSFIALIFIGALLLKLPFATYQGISFTDALFTSTSSVCVTGLIVLDTAKDFTLFGQGVILMLIQLGGFGIMTFSMGLLTFLGGDLSIKWRYTFKDIYSDVGIVPIGNILSKVVKYTFIIESITAVLLFMQFVRDFPVGDALRHAVFHAISAFCNAGFSTFSDSLIRYQNNPYVMTVISLAIILGGLGFIVLHEVIHLRTPFLKSASRYQNLSLHSKISLNVSLILILLGMLTFLLLEWDYSLKGKSVENSLLVSFFQSVTCRTAGFNSVDISKLRESTHFMMISLMFIGGSPGSIAGGVKTTTIAVIFLLIVSRFKGKSKVSIQERTLDRDTVDRSTTLFLLSMVFISMVLFVMLALHEFDIRHSFISVLFETVSAFGTVGLSLGITNQLPDVEKIVLSFVMLIGRLGPLTLIMAFTLKKKTSTYEYPKEHIMIG